jgi:threonine aldolase
MIDLSSDTATRPTPAMRDAIASAEVGDEQRGEDPTVNELQRRVAELLGHEAALFAVTGTFCNRLAVAALTAPGDSVIIESNAHLLRYESGGPALMSGVLLEQVPGDRGTFTAEQLDQVITPGSAHISATTLVALEQTHNLAGGAIWPLDRYTEVVDLAHQRAVKVHVDGARLLNAVVASGVPAATWGGMVDSVWIDFTKGLGAPIGAVIAGRAPFIARCRRFKHLFGGAMRQAGIAAAGCLHALDHHVDRLADDHANATRLAEGLRAAGIQVEAPDTNMVYFDPPAGWTFGDFEAAIEGEGVRMGPVGRRVRAVTHLDVDAAGIETAIEVVAAVVAGGPPTAGGDPGAGEAAR